VRGTKRISDPVSVKDLEGIRKQIRSRNWERLSKAVTWSCCCLGYFGSFRMGELLSKSKNGFDQSSDLTWNDLKERPDGFTITVKNPKSGRKTELVEIFEFPKKRLCPVRSLRKLRSLQKKGGVFDPFRPVFRFGSGSCLTQRRLNKFIGRLGRKSVFGKNKWTGKSFRAGLPSDMERGPPILEKKDYQKLGRWSSNAFECYLKENRAERKWEMEKIHRHLIDHNFV